MRFSKRINWRKNVLRKEEHRGTNICNWNTILIRPRRIFASPIPAAGIVAKLLESTKATRLDPECMYLWRQEPRLEDKGYRGSMYGGS